MSTSRKSTPKSGKAAKRPTAKAAPKKAKASTGPKTAPKKGGAKAAPERTPPDEQPPTELENSPPGSGWDPGMYAGNPCKIFLEAVRVYLETAI